MCGLLSTPISQALSIYRSHLSFKNDQLYPLAKT